METVVNKRGAVTVTHLSGPADVEGLLVVFEEIAAQEGWCPGGQLRAYTEPAYHLAAQVEGVIVGGMQIVRSALHSMPYRAVWPEIEVHAAGEVAEVTILAVRPEWRGRPGLFWPLCTALWRLCIAEQIESLVLQSTSKMLNRYRKVGFPLEVIGDLREHWGEPAYLCRLDVREVAGALMEMALRFPSYRSLIGQALQPGIRPACASIATLP